MKRGGLHQRPAEGTALHRAQDIQRSTEIVVEAEHREPEAYTTMPMARMIACSTAAIVLSWTLPANGPRRRNVLSRVVSCSHFAIDA